MFGVYLLRECFCLPARAGSSGFAMRPGWDLNGPVEALILIHLQHITCKTT